MLVEFSASVRECLCLVGLEVLNEMNLVVSILMSQFRHWNRNFSLAIFSLFSMVSNRAFVSSSVGESVSLHLLNTKQIAFRCTPSS